MIRRKLFDSLLSTKAWLTFNCNFECTFQQSLRKCLNNLFLKTNLIVHCRQVIIDIVFDDVTKFTFVKLYQEFFCWSSSSYQLLLFFSLWYVFWLLFMFLFCFDMFLKFFFFTLTWYVDCVLSNRFALLNRFD